MLMTFSFKMPWRYVEQVAAPNMALKMLDMATQVHGGAGVSSGTVLAHLWATQEHYELQMAQIFC
jgi:alkylation response protein AidB-like acyl-CoA dehydrogenase